MTPIDPERPQALLAGLTPRQFMQRHWQRKPLLVRGAMPVSSPFVGRAELFAMAARQDVESRVVVADGSGWKLRHGPVARRALPPLAQPRWTLLVQGMDLHMDAAHALMQRFRFVPDARLDDVMVSYATDGGGVGPHLDSYDVFLLQIHGRRRWRIGRVPHPELQPDVPLKILTNFEPEVEWTLEPGDMLYLPPRWGHDGIADGECMTCSIGFRTPGRDELARELVLRSFDEDTDDPIYRDPQQPATERPGEVPQAMLDFAVDGLQRRLADRVGLARSLGEVLSEPKPIVWFEPDAGLQPGRGVVADRRTRMLYDRRHVFINGESYRAGGRDATLMRRLADRRSLDATEVASLGDDARSLLDDWVQSGWMHPAGD
jgi:50S ribosomal protein L16 3-hydroxylase